MAQSDLRARLQALENTSQALNDAVATRVSPAGWEPGIHWTGTEGTISTGPLEAPPDPALWAELVADWGLDPAITEVIPGTVEIRAWDAAIGGGAIQRMKYYKAKLRRRVDPDEANRVDFEDLYKEVRKAKPSRTPKPDGSATFVVALSDFQVGNGDGGGVREQVERLAALPDQLRDRVADLRRSGDKIGTIAVLGLGDLVENVCGFYPAQPYRVEANLRDQVKLVRRALRDITMTLAPAAPRMVVACVPGNHGEATRQNGKQITAPGDNHDVAVFEQVAEMLAVNPDAYGHIDWRIPRDEIAVSLSLSGQIVALTHGHVPRPSGGPVNAMWKWWTEQAMGRAYPGVADASMLFCGHFHHFNVKEQDGRLLLICPSLTAVGEYWQDEHGTITRAGTLTLVIDNDGWGNLSII